MQALIEKIRKSRQKQIKAEGYSLTIRRPTDLEIQENHTVRDSLIQSGILSRYVIGWDGITELDLIAGGTGAAVDFSSELFMEWVADKPGLWTVITDQVVDLYKLHQQQTENAEKKP